MAAPRGVYTPKSGVLVGQTFPSYYQYQQANARAIGVGSYNEQRKLFASPFARSILRSEQQRGNFGPSGKLAPTDRFELQRVIAANSKWDAIKRQFVSTVNTKDHARGGSLDQFLIALKRRTGNEPWLPGETPR